MPSATVQLSPTWTDAKTTTYLLPLPHNYVNISLYVTMSLPTCRYRRVARYSLIPIYSERFRENFGRTKGRSWAADENLICSWISFGGVVIGYLKLNINVVYWLIGVPRQFDGFIRNCGKPLRGDWTRLVIANSWPIPESLRI